MFKQATLITNNLGITLVEAIVTTALLGGVALIAININSQNKDATKSNIDRNSFLTTHEYIIAQTSYRDSCLSSAGLSNSELITLINNQKGLYKIIAPDNTLLESNVMSPFFNINIKNLSIDKIQLVKSAYGFKFYSGELSVSLSKGQITQIDKIGALNFLVNDVNQVIACSSRSDLQEHPDYLYARENNPL